MKEEDKLPYAKAFWELRGCERTRELQQQLFELSKDFPVDETCSLADQLRRASCSVGAQIAEEWGKRHSIRHFESRLTDALGENNETRHWIIGGVDDGCLSPEKSRLLFERSLQIGRLIQAMIHRADEFCTGSANPQLREPTPSFFSPLPTFCH
jgi:four helix bundle protein